MFPFPCPLLAVSNVAAAGSGPAFRSAGAINGTGTASSYTVDYPAGIQANDILFLHVSSRDDSGSADVSSLSDAGFALVQSSNTGGTVDTFTRLYWKRASGTESGTVTITLTENVTNAISAAIMSAWSGAVASGTPYEANTANQQLTATTSVVGSTITTLGAHRRVISFFGHANTASSSYGTTGSGSNTNGWDGPHYDTKTGLGDGHTFACSSIAAPTAGSVSACTRTISQALSNVCHTLALIGV
jgi:hypothetical protein